MLPRGGDDRDHEVVSAQNRAAFERQLALERRALAELLLDIYESRLGREGRGLDPEWVNPTMKEEHK